jgi:DNA polymerase III alpha subunit (gram-positive type)
MFKNICYLDTETTGLDPETGQIIELYVADYDVNGRKTEHLFRFAFDESKADKRALKINKYYDRKELWDNAKPFKEYLMLILDLLMEKTIVAHNVSFDASFLLEEFKRCGIARKPWKRPLDTYSISKFLLEGSSLFSCSMKALRYFFNLEKSSSHTAKDDVEDLIKIVEHMQRYRDSRFARLRYNVSFKIRDMNKYEANLP